MYRDSKKLLTSSLMTVALLKDRNALVIFFPKSAKTMATPWARELTQLASHNRQRINFRFHDKRSLPEHHNT
jgi:hypothetical protein